MTGDRIVPASMPASPTATPDRIKDANTRYHDAAAGEYDAKWGIDFGAVGQRQVRLKLAKALGGLDAERFGDGLEIGSGTGYFSLNLLQMGTLERLTATDISAGMLGRLSATAEALGLEAETVESEAERLPFDDDSFDLVFGHAVLHHIPDLERAFAEFRRVLRPGGAIAFCGEPSRYGDRLAAAPKRAGALAAPAWRRLVGASPRSVAEADQSHDHALESEVDVHAFAPADLRRLLRDGGFERPRVGGEELLANAWGWGLRTVEASAEPDSVPWSWRRFAFNSYMTLQKVDTRLLEPRLPAELFYNLLLSGRKPA
jgi:ubiquinone/menaquinone biosynthesis C-methylase UbiE